MPSSSNPPPPSSRRPVPSSSGDSGGSDSADSFGDALPPAPPPAGPSQPPATLAYGDTQYGDSAEAPISIPGYEVLGELGRGGMGVVYKARQLKLNRLVALKMSRSGEMTHEDLVRFRAEAESVARLRHPNIVQIYEVGEYQNRPYFSFEYVDGGSLSEFIRGTPQPPMAAAEMVETLALAMHVAHKEGIIHRDLKPANVLLAGAGDASHRGSTVKPVDQQTLVHSVSRFTNPVPKIADFGVAKRLDKNSMHTATGAVLGTPNYMAPEQAWGSNRRKPVGPPADVYALGAILYEMLTGRPPFLGETPLDTLQQVVTQEPVAPTRLQPRVPKDLETICLKCLQKEPARRYESADELGADLRRFLTDVPIKAKAAGPVTRLLRWRRRNPAVAALLVVALLLLLAGTTVSTYFAFELQFSAKKAQANANEAIENKKTAEDMALQAKANEETAKAYAREAEKNLNEAKALQLKAEADSRERDKLLRVVYGWYISIANTALSEKKTGQLHNALDSLIPENVKASDVRGFEWYHMRQRSNRPPVTLEKTHESPVTALAFSPDGATFATANADTDLKGKKSPVSIRVWYTQSGRRLDQLERKADRTVHCVSFSPDGSRLACASDDGVVKVWTIQSNKDQPDIVCKTEGAATSVVFSQDGGTLVCGSTDKTVRFWNAHTGELIRTWSGFPDAVQWLALHPGGTSIALACRDGTVIVRDMGTGREANRLESQARSAGHIAWHPQGKQLALCLPDGKVQLWDVAANTSVVAVPNPVGKVFQVAFSPDGNHLATACDDKVVHLLGAASLTRLKNYGEHRSEVRCLAFSAQGRWLASADADGAVVLREFGVWPACTVLTGHTARVDDVAWNSDGTVLASSRGVHFGQSVPTAGSEVILWNLIANRPEHNLTGHAMQVYGIGIHPSGKSLATASRDGTVRLWDAVKGQEAAQITRQALPCYAVAWSPDGTRLATTYDVRQGEQALTRITVWDMVTFNQILSFTTEQLWMDVLVWSPDGKWLAGASSLAQLVWLWDARTGEMVHRFSGHTGSVHGLAFSHPTPGGPGSRWLASASADKSVRVWDVVEKKQLQVLRGHVAEVHAVAFHHDGNRLASGGDDNVVRLWDLETQKEVFRLEGHTDAVLALAFRPDGFQLASTSRDGTVRVWDATPLPGERPSDLKSPSK